jgi:hypothetical protein
MKRASARIRLARAIESFGCANLLRSHHLLGMPPCAA